MRWSIYLQLVSYDSPGGKWTKTVLESRPCHQKLWCGNLLTKLQLNFVVKNLEIPTCCSPVSHIKNKDLNINYIKENTTFIICGVCAEYPKVSGSQNSLQRTPNSLRKNLWPSRNCRIKDSPLKIM